MQLIIFFVAAIIGSSVVRCNPRPSLGLLGPATQVLKLAKLPLLSLRNLLDAVALPGRLANPRNDKPLARIEAIEESVEGTEEGEEENECEEDDLLTYYGKNNSCIYLCNEHKTWTPLYCN